MCALLCVHDSHQYRCQSVTSPTIWQQISFGRNEELVAADVTEEDSVPISGKPLLPLFGAGEGFVRVTSQQAPGGIGVRLVLQKADESLQGIDSAVGIYPQRLKLAIDAIYFVSIDKFKIALVILHQSVRVRCVFFHKVRGERGGEEVLILYPVDQGGEPESVQSVTRIASDQWAFAVETLDIAYTIDKEFFARIRHL